MSTQLDLNKKYRDSELPKWERLLLSLFNNDIPERKEITSKREIIEILNVIGTSDADNHAFMPDGGGMDLLGCEEAGEQGCITMDMGVPTIVKPNKLIFQSFPGGSCEWSYFYLIADDLKLSGVYGDRTVERMSEELTEIRPGEYIDRGYGEHGEYNGETLPESAQIIVRYLNGNFVIFSKASIYNLANTPDFDAYDATHQTLGEETFKKLIEKLSLSFR